jgi:hypothetical protein
MNPNLSRSTINSFHEKADPCQEFFSALSMISSIFSRSAKPPLSPPFHPHSYVSDVRSVQVGCSRFSRRCHLISVLCFSLYIRREVWAQELIAVT